MVCGALTVHVLAAAAQLACMRHFQCEPLSTLAAAACGAGSPRAARAALRRACEALPAALLRGGFPEAGSSGVRGAEAAVSESLAAWSGWAAALHCVHVAARAVGLGQPAGAYRLFHISMMLLAGCQGTVVCCSCMYHCKLSGYSSIS